MPGLDEFLHVDEADTHAACSCGAEAEVESDHEVYVGAEVVTADEGEVADHAGAVDVGAAVEVGEAGEDQEGGGPADEVTGADHADDEITLAGKIELHYPVVQILPLAIVDFVLNIAPTELCRCTGHPDPILQALEATFRHQLIKRKPI